MKTKLHIYKDHQTTTTYCGLDDIAHISLYTEEKHAAFRPLVSIFNRKLIPDMFEHKYELCKACENFYVLYIFKERLKQ